VDPATGPYQVLYGSRFGYLKTDPGGIYAALADVIFYEFQQV